MSEILVYSDKWDHGRELVCQARKFAAELGLGVSAAALGPGAKEVATQLAGFGADHIYVSEDAALEGLQPEVVAEAIAQIAEHAGATYLLISSTRRGKDLTGRVAQRLGAGALSDTNAMVVEDGQLIGKRYALGGNTVAEERIDTPVKVFGVVPKTFEVAALEAGAGEVRELDLSLSASLVRVISRHSRESQAVNLESAPRIVGVGRGFAKREDLVMAQALAIALEAQLGCTKSLADFQWLSEEHIIGLSGARAKPECYLALGISGQIQHTVGISQAKVIVAVNKDKEAPIFQLADYGIVGDVYELVPALLESLKR